jgi:beta-barrel assembly-enhancing protease
MRTTLLAGAALLLAGCGGTLPQVPLDALGRIGQQALPIGPRAEREIGFGIAATVAGRYPLAADPALQAYVARVGLTVAEQSVRRHEIPFHFGVLESDDVNAFAAPGGYVLVTRGALALMSSEAELAGVLAHEVAHVDQQHVLTAIRRSSVMQTVRDETHLASVLDELAGVGGSLLFTGLERGDEMEADSLALVYVRGAGYRADGLVRFLTAVEAVQAGPRAGRLRELGHTHPAAGDRLAAPRRQIAATGVDPAAGAEGAERFRRHVPR